MKKIFTAVLACIALTSCVTRSQGFTPEETALIAGADSMMRVLTISDSSDMAVLRGISSNLPAEALLSDDYTRLSELMTATVTHPSQDGVGIAAPQVGLNRRIVTVQRFDKEGEPFETYPNIRIVCLSDSMEYGPEGCLSVPDMRADVLRSRQVVIEYTDMRQLKELASRMSRREFDRKFGSRSGRKGSTPLPTVRDTVSGFTAVIFQHETDHLDGILYIDRL